MYKQAWNRIVAVGLFLTLILVSLPGGVVPGVAQDSVQVIEITQPSGPMVHAPGADVLVKWNVLVIDATQETYLVELIGSSGVVDSTNDYVCNTRSECEATITFPEVEDAYEIVVRTVGAQTLADTALSACNPITNGPTSLCDFVNGQVIDMTAPETAITISGTAGANGWYTSRVTVSLSCVDSLSSAGCQTVYRFDSEDGQGPEIVYQGAFRLPADGRYTLSYRSIDGAGNDEEWLTTDLAQDRTPPVATLTVDTLPTGSAGWYLAQPLVAATCEDAASGAATFATIVNGDQSNYSVPFHVAGDGIHSIALVCEDAAGLSASVNDITIKQDLSAPTLAFCILVADDCTDATSLDSGVVTLRVVGEDGDGSGVALREVTAEGPEGTLGPVALAQSTDQITLDLRDILETPRQNFWQGAVTFSARAVDAVGGETSVTLDTVDVADTPEKEILLSLVGNPQTFVPNDTEVTLGYAAVRLDTGDAAAGHLVTLTDANDAAFSMSGQTDLSGLVSFTLDDADTQRVLQATLTPSTLGIDEVHQPGPVTATWTDILLEREQSEDEPQTNLWADINETYRLAYNLTYSWNGAPVPGAQVKLSSPEGVFSGLTSTAGTVKVPTSFAAPSEVEFAVGASFTPSNGPVQSAADQNVTVRWAKVVFEDLEVMGRDDSALRWHNITDPITFSFDAFLVYGDGPANRTPADGAAFDLVSGTTVLCEGVEVVDGSGTCSFAALDPVALTPQVELVSTPEGVSVQDDAGYSEQRWAVVEFTDLTVENSGNSVPGWHDVGDEVVFRFKTVIRFGAAETDTIPAEGATVDFVGSAQELLVVNATGAAQATVSFDGPMAHNATLDLLSTEQGLMAHDQMTFAEQRWATVVFTAGTPVNPDNSVLGWHAVDDGVDFPFTARIVYAADGQSIPAEGAVVNLTAGDQDVPLTMDAAGEAVGELSFAEPVKVTPTLSLDSTVQGISAFDLEDFGDQRWTEIVIDHGVDDDFVDIGSNVTFEITAHWAHDEDGNESTADDVGSADLSLVSTNGTAFPCGLTAGVASCVANFADLYADNITIRVDATDMGVTRAQGGDFPSEKVVWTALLVDYETDVPEASVLDHNAPVIFNGTLRFAHDQSPVTFGAFIVREVGNTTEFVCITDDAGGSCPVEVSRESGEATYEVEAFSTTLEGTLLETDITKIYNAPRTVDFRWTSIGFLGFTCWVGDMAAACDSDFDERTLVTVEVTAVAEDTRDESTPDILSGAVISIGGKTYVTGDDGKASRPFTRFSAGCVGISARGTSATIDGTEVGWDTPRFEEICFV